MEQKISYSAVVLDDRSKELLKTKFGHILPNGWEWVCHHMTICMGPITDEGVRSKIGSTVTLNVVQVGASNLALAVTAFGFYTQNKIPHITLGVNMAGGGKPKDSNGITLWEGIGEDIRVTGVVTEIPFKPAPLNESITDVNTLPFIGDVKQLGGKIYQVGGAVRDQFLGKVSKDLDIVVQGVPAKSLMDILAKYGAVKEQTVGGTFAMIKFIPNGSKEEIDIAIPRTERKVGAGYTGFEVNADHTLPIEKDLERRDFTINSIAKDLDGNITDPFGGQIDLRNKVIRVTNPIAFKEDPLRMLRAVQFASRFGFHIEPTTFKLIQENAPAIKEISGERILIEFDKIVQKGDCFLAVGYLASTGLFKEIFGFEFSASDAKWYRKVTRMSEFIYLMMRWEAYRVNPRAFYLKRFKGDVDTGKELEVFDRVSKDEGGTVNRCFMIYNANKLSPAAVQSFIVREYYGAQGILNYMKQYDMPIFKPLQINGDDLIALGIPEGKEHGILLKAMLSAIFNGKLKNNKEDLVKFAQQSMLQEQVNTIKDRFR